jgi:hypothetical protein
MVDKFWKIFWIGSGSVTILGLVIAMSLFLFFTRQSNLLAAVGVSYEAGKDPFEGSTLQALGGGMISLVGGYLYQNSLPLHFQSWTWQATADWRSTEQKKEGSAALKIVSTAPGGTVGMSGPGIVLKNIKSISLSVYPDANVGDLLLDLYDKNGNSLGTQSIGWYATSSTLAPNQWQQVVIPLHNFLGQPNASTVSGFSISTKNPGVVYVDAVQLSGISSDHPAWVAPPEEAGHAFDPFATSSPVALPYTFSPTPDSLSRWYTYFGLFAPGASGQIETGPLASTKSTGSMSVFRGGRKWADYHVDAMLDWGEASAFSLLSRFSDDGNFVSCAFSRYGETAQIYQVKKGVSTFVSQTPPLAVKDYEPWIGVKVGMQVEGNKVSCYINDAWVLGATITDMPPSGSTGIETWDPNPSAAPDKLRTFSVSSLTGE